MYPPTTVAAPSKTYLPSLVGDIECLGNCESHCFCLKWEQEKKKRKAALTFSLTGRLTHLCFLAAKKGVALQFLGLSIASNVTEYLIIIRINRTIGYSKRERGGEKRERERERQRERQREIQRERERQRQRDKWTKRDRQRQRQAGRQNGVLVH